MLTQRIPISYNRPRSISRKPIKVKAGIIDRLSESAVKCFLYAEMYQKRGNYKLLFSEHLLLGIIHQSENQPNIPYIKNLPTLTTTKVYLATQEIYPVSREKEDEYREDRFSLEIRDILYASEQERITKRKEYITPYGLLYAILSTPTRAYKVLQELKVDISLLKDTIYKELKAEEDQTRINVLSPPKQLNELCRNLCELAKEGKLDPVIGRTTELERLVQVMSRRMKANPLLLGDPGVGKTALIEGLAYQMVHEPMNLPANIRDKIIMQLDITSILSGTSERGELEKRLVDLLKLLKENKNIILFIDEIHTIVAGSGKTSIHGSNEDGSTLTNMLKPALARGEISCIGSTTYDEYVKYFQSDPAFDRRFQPIYIDEPSKIDTTHILFGLKKLYEAYHKCSYTNEAVTSAVDLSIRYLPNRKLPDKAIDLLDEAGSMARIKKISTVTPEMIKDILTAWTGIPLIFGEEDLEQKLKEQIIGQEDAVEAVVQAMRRNKVMMRDPKKPIASFLFTGPTGVGKTQLAKLLAEYTPNSELIRLDMSEYGEAFAVNTLLGAAPGYVGYDRPGVLTEAVKRNPYSVVLFDEIEKAHPNIWNILLQILEDGILADAKNKRVTFKDTLIILTCNEMPKFKPELLNRFDEIIPFNPLSQETINTITEKLLQETFARIETITSYQINLSDETKAKILQEGFNPDYGAREIRRTITHYIEDKVADILLDKSVLHGKTITI